MRKGEREQKTVSALVVGHNMQEEGCSPPHPWDFTGCFLFHPRGTALTFILVSQNHSSPIPCICACVYAYAFFVFFLQNLKHTFASLTCSCYIRFAYMFLLHLFLVIFRLHLSQVQHAP